MKWKDIVDYAKCMNVMFSSLWMCDGPGQCQIYQSESVDLNVSYPDTILHRLASSPP